jgi:hypothetical protein
MKTKPTFPRSPALAGDFGGRRPLMGESLPVSRHLRAGRRPQAGGLRSVTLLVPESCAEGLQDLARVLRARQRGRTGDPLFGWRRVSPSTELMVDPGSAARCTIRDTRATGAKRYHWTVTVIGETEPVAAGHSEGLTEARSQSEKALLAYVSGGLRNGSGIVG